MFDDVLTTPSPHPYVVIGNICFVMSISNLVSIPTFSSNVPFLNFDDVTGHALTCYLRQTECYLIILVILGKWISELVIPGKKELVILDKKVVQNRSIPTTCEYFCPRLFEMLYLRRFSFRARNSRGLGRVHIYGDVGCKYKTRKYLSLRGVLIVLKSRYSKII